MGGKGGKRGGRHSKTALARKQARQAASLGYAPKGSDPGNLARAAVAHGDSGWGWASQSGYNSYAQTPAQKAAAAKQQKQSEAKTKIGSITSSYDTKFADYSKAFEPSSLSAEKPNALTQIGKALRYTNPLTGFALQGIGSMMSPRQNANLSISNAFSPSMTSKDTFGITSGMGINTANQYGKVFTTPYQGLAGPPSLGERAKDAALGALQQVTKNPLQTGLSAIGDLTFHSMDQLGRLKNVKDTPWAPVNKVKNYLGEYGGALAGFQGAAENLGHYFRAQVDPTTNLNRVGRVLTTEKDKIASDMTEHAQTLSPERRLQIAAGDQVTASELGDAGTYNDGYVPGFNVAWTKVQRDPEGLYKNLGFSAMEKMSHQLGADADVGMDIAGNVFNATDNYTFSDEKDFSVPGGKYLHKLNEGLKTIGQFTNPDRQTGPGTEGVTTKVTYNLADRPAPTVSGDFAKLAAMSNDPSSSLYSPTRDSYTRGLGTDTKALRRNQFSSSPNSNLDRSLAQVSGALKSTSDQVAQQANLGISGYLSQANEQRAAAQKHLANLRGGRTDLAAEIAKLKEGYSDVDVDTKGLEELEGQYATAETDITKQLSDYDQNVRGYVTQWQQSAQTPQWTMGVRAKGNIYKSPLQQFGRKARTTSNKIKTPGSEFTIGGLASAWNPTLNI